MTSPRKETGPAAGSSGERALETRPVVVIGNPHARKLRRGSRMREILSTVPSARFPDGLDALAAAARDAVDADARVVVLAGGDGSYGPAVSALREAATLRGRPVPAVALVPAGTACTIARNWGFEGGGLASLGTRDAERYTRRLLRAIARGQARRTRRPTLDVRLDDRDGRVAFILGAGLVSRFFERYEALGASGYRSAFLLAARVIASAATGTALAHEVLAPVRCRVTVDGRASGLDAVTLFLASVVADLGLGLRAAPRAGREVMRFHALASSDPARRLVSALPRVLAGRAMGSAVDALASEVELAFDAPETVVVDGDRFGAKRVVVSAGPPIDVVSP